MKFSMQRKEGEVFMTINSNSFTSSELLCIMSARALNDGQVVFAGVGIPLLAATLAQRLHAPGLTILFEGGTIGPHIVPGELPPTTNEQRCTRKANMLVSITEVLLLLQRGYVDIGFMGGAQIDKFGNLNSSFIGSVESPSVRLPGTGGGNDIASLSKMIVAMPQEKRRFVDKVDFITSPGYLDGGSTRKDSGLISGGMYRIVTDLGILGFDENGRMQVEALHPGVTTEQVSENTGFELKIDENISRTEPPTEEELSALRILDPDKVYIA